MEENTGFANPTSTPAFAAHPTPSANIIASATSSSVNNNEAGLPSQHCADDDSRQTSLSASNAKLQAGTLAVGSNENDVQILKDGKSLSTRFYEDCQEADTSMHSPRLRSSRGFKGKGKGVVSPMLETKHPLCLLDLPVDILKEIVKEVTHTNDLTSLALSHSALHSLTIPHIYSRFDIVWPDSSTHAEPRSGVDALTYGLATLVMAEEIFGEAPWQQQQQQHMQPSFRTSDPDTTGNVGRVSDRQIRRRRGNYYAQYTRKFSLGNGPADWVSEYSIGKEGGKMLGTLVALAVARMHSLETFIWDMPTGILRDVWLALSSLADRLDGKPCRLEKFWMRWHDNSAADVAVPVQPPGGTATPTIPPQIPLAALDRIEHPNFSVLPPLVSLSVLDVDELAYLDEMSVLIGRSLHKLRELRLGIARHALGRDWVTVWEGDGVQQTDRQNPTAASLIIGEKRLGGVLGILTSFVYDMRRPKLASPSRRTRRSSTHLNRNSRIAMPAGEALGPSITLNPATTSTILSDITSLRDVLPDVPTNEPGQQITWTTDEEADPLLAMGNVATPSSSPTALQDDEENTARPQDATEGHEPAKILLSECLQLKNLELERVPLSIPVLHKALDWTQLTSLTLLHCQNHEQLWKTLRRAFPPTPRSPTYPNPRRTPASYLKKSRSSVVSPDCEMVYPLNLKKIHTNTVSSALIALLRDTLAPDSLQSLFLQDARSYNSPATIDLIFKGVLKRHRNSLSKVLIDSSEKGSDGLPVNSSRWRRWMLTREVLAFVTGGKMPALREIGVALDYRDWHFFLQRLPSIPHLRSLYGPFLADHPHGSGVDAKELALQVVDIVALRPEVELCYMGIANKCFEILENRRGFHEAQAESAYFSAASGTVHDGLADGDGVDDDEADLDGTDEVDEIEEEEDDEDENTESDDDDDHDDDDDDDDDDEEEAAQQEDTESDSGSSVDGVQHTARLRLREILFYDDKVSVFKARHGRL